MQVMKRRNMCCRVFVFLLVMDGALAYWSANYFYYPISGICPVPEYYVTTTTTPQRAVPVVAGGTNAEINEFPHMVSLGFGSLTNPSWLCGGSLISFQFILTAAHCTSDQILGSVRVVRLGTNNLTSQSYQDVLVAQIIPHPNYRPPSAYNDIALLRLQQGVFQPPSIIPAYLDSGPIVPIKTFLTALGWGKTSFAGPRSDTLMKVDLRVVASDECSTSYLRLWDKLPQGIRDNTQLCAGNEIGKDTCQGDSGGPLGYKNGGIHYIVGITSFGKACAISGAPGVYTRVAAFIPWIQSVVGL